jgi:DNA-binding transcriptional MerR regulator
VFLEKDGEAVARLIAVKPLVDPKQDIFGIRDLAEEFGISTRTIRFYEDKGLLAPRRVNNSRVYARVDRARLALILRAKRLGSSLDEIRHYLDLYGREAEGRKRQLRYVIERAEETLTRLERQKAHIDATLKEIRTIRKICRQKLKSNT